MLTRLLVLAALFLSRSSATPARAADAPAPTIDNGPGLHPDVEREEWGVTVAATW